MTLTPNEQDIAETLLRKWKAQKDVSRYRRKLNCVAESLTALSEAIKSELEGGQSRAIVKRQQGQVFSVNPVNQIGGRIETHDLTKADELAELANGYRIACEALERSEREVDEL